MELGRRSPQFSRLAAAVERELEWRGLAVDPGLVDDVLRTRIAETAELRGARTSEAVDLLPRAAIEWLVDELAHEAVMTPEAQGTEVPLRNRLERD